jgi:hypothetical protein
MRFLSSRARLLLAAGMVVGSVAGAGLAAPAAAAPTGRDFTRWGCGCKWSGYAVKGTGFTSVRASWQEPAVTCGSADDLYAPWIGLDGYGSSTVEQTGVAADCTSGTGTPQYYAWYETYPADSVNYTDTVEPGDWFDASVMRSGTTYTLTLHDRTRGWTESVAQTSDTATNTSAEAVIEDPLGYYPNFGHVTFESVSINDKPLSGWNPDSLNSFDANGNKTSNGDISRGGTYTITYLHE